MTRHAATDGPWWRLRAALRHPGFTAGTVEVDGCRIHHRISANHRVSAETSGGGPTYVLVHGLIVSGRYMMPLATHLAAHGQVLVPDLPGFGASEKPDPAPRVPELARRLAGYLAAIGPRPVVLVANSFGCQMVAAMAAECPEVFARPDHAGWRVSAETSPAAAAHVSAETSPVAASDLSAETSSRVEARVTADASRIAPSRVSAETSPAAAPDVSAETSSRMESRVAADGSPVAPAHVSAETPPAAGPQVSAETSPRIGARDFAGGAPVGPCHVSAETSPTTGHRVSAETSAVGGLVARVVFVGPTMDPAARSAPRQLARLIRSMTREPFEFPAVLLADLLRVGVRRALRAARVALADRIEESLPRVPVPTLVVRGSRDPIVPRRWAEQAARLLPRGRLVEIPGGGHALNYGAADALAEVVRAFTTEPLAPPPGRP